MLSHPALPRRVGQQCRFVANLVFSEIIVIWALRHSTPSDKGRCGDSAKVATELSRAFGLARLEESLASLSAIALGLGEAGRLPESKAKIDDDRVTAREEGLLGALAAYQQRDEDLAARLIEWLVLRPEQNRLALAVKTLAKIMVEAGLLIPQGPENQRPRARLAALAGDAGFRSGAPQPLPYASDWQDLTLAERHLLGGCRLWVQAYRKKQDPLAALRLHFGQRPAIDPGLSLHAILRNTTLTATRPVDVRCLRCPGLSPDEARLLASVAHLQYDSTEAAKAALGDWLPPSALRMTLDAARGLATALAMTCDALPLRAWDFAALEKAAHPPPRTEGAEDVENADSEIRFRDMARATAPTLH